MKSSTRQFYESFRDKTGSTTFKKALFTQFQPVLTHRLRFARHIMNRLRKFLKNNKNLKPAASDDFTSASLNWLKISIALKNGLKTTTSLPKRHE